jgi:hypothetical protein
VDLSGLSAVLKINVASDRGCSSVMVVVFMALLSLIGFTVTKGPLKSATTDRVGSKSQYELVCFAHTSVRVLACVLRTQGKTSEFRRVRFRLKIR